MKKYLIDTNVFWEILCDIAGIPVTGKKFDTNTIRRNECFISEITKIEIMSVMGKYARGEQGGWQPCDRIIGENKARCTERYFKTGRKKWKNKRVEAMKRLVKDILGGNSEVLRVQVLSVSDEVIAEAEKFIRHAFRYKFASLDAVIAATAIVYDRENFIIATHDGSFRKALEDEGIHIMKESETAAVPVL